MSIGEDPRAYLGRLLGPVDPEVSCELCFERLDEYVEVELELGPGVADARIPGFRAHLEGCPACHEDHESLRALVREDRTQPSPTP